MVLTRWSGGRTGTEQMPENYNSMYYTEVHREVPRLYRDESDPPYGYGYFVGETGSYSQHDTIYPYRAGSLVVEVGGVTVPSGDISEQSPANGIFEIRSNTTGYVRVSYLMYDDALYFEKKTPEGLPLSSTRSRMIPTKREHIDEILEALDTISSTIGAIRRRFSIQEFTGFPVEYFSGSGVRSGTPLLAQLYQEIHDQIKYLFEYSLSRFGASIVPPGVVTYTYQHVNAETIEGFRQDINTLENALDEVGQ